jgi:hypothetical protein
MTAPVPAPESEPKRTGWLVRFIQILLVLGLLACVLFASLDDATRTRVMDALNGLKGEITSMVQGKK